MKVAWVERRTCFGTVFLFSLVARFPLDHSWGHATWWAASSPAATSVEEPQNDQKHDGADRGGDDCGYDAGTKADTQLGQQPTADKGADDPKSDVGEET